MVWGPNVEEMQFKIAVHERMKNVLVAQEKKPTEPPIPMNFDDYWSDEM